MSDNFKIGTVKALFSGTNTAKVQFDGETEASEKQYAYLSSYIPKVNDRVMLAAVSGTYVILGSILYNKPPDTPSYPSNPSFSSVSVSGTVSVSGHGTFGSLRTSGTCEIDGNLDHDGSYVGFFGTSPTSKKTVYYANSDDIGVIRQRLNALIQALGYYGLISPSN